MNNWKWGFVIAISCAVFTFTAQRVAAFTSDYHDHKVANAADLAALHKGLEAIDAKLNLIIRICPRERP